MKNARFYKHYSNARNKDGLLAMREKYGSTGYGWYCIITEIMLQQDNYAINTSGKYWVNLICNDTGASKAEMIEYIKDCVKDFKVFSVDGNMLTNNILADEISDMKKKSESARKSALVRWGGKKKRKTKKEVGMAVLTNKKLWEEFRSELLKSKDFKSIGAVAMDVERDKSLDWLRSKGRRQKDYRAFYRNWLRNKKKYGGISDGKKTNDGMVL